MSKTLEQKRAELIEVQKKRNLLYAKELDLINYITELEMKENGLGLPTEEGWYETSDGQIARLQEGRWDDGWGNAYHEGSGYGDLVQLAEALPFKKLVYEEVK